MLTDDSGPAMPPMDEHLRLQVLDSFGSSRSAAEELLAYNKNVFDHESLKVPLSLPFPDELFLTAWDRYLKDSLLHGVFGALLDPLVQFRFPVTAGMKTNENYRKATLQGEDPSLFPEATGIGLENPECMRLEIHETPAGRIPVLIPFGRADFITVLRALTEHNEPVSIPASMGAAMIAGYNNWERIHTKRREYQAGNPFIPWEIEFRTHVIPHRDLYQDRFIILSDGPYSSTAAQDIGLSGIEWLSFSTVIRREHECAHYFTKRLFSSMHNNIIDELIADYAGITAAFGNYRPDLFLRFLGLESFPDYRPGGRLENYRGTPPLSGEAFRILQQLVKSASENVGTFDTRERDLLNTPGGKAIFLFTLTFFTLEELASEDAVAMLSDRFSLAGQQIQYNSIFGAI